MYILDTSTQTTSGSKSAASYKIKIRVTLIVVKSKYFINDLRNNIIL